MDNSGNYLILFADLVGSTEVAVEVDPSFYAKTYVASFHWAARRAMKFIKNKKVFKHEQFKKTIQDTDIRIAGDEALSFTLLDYAKLTDIEREDIVASAIAFAYVTKLYWLASPPHPSSSSISQGILSFPTASSSCLEILEFFRPEIS